MEPLARITPATVDVLRVLTEADVACWGLLIIKSSGRPAGSVYPILERLESIGWLTSFWETDASRPGPRRRYYELTNDGATAASAAIATLDAKTRAGATRRSGPGTSTAPVTGMVTGVTA